jgi:hypothetical protein
MVLLSISLLSVLETFIEMLLEPSGGSYVIGSCHSTSATTPGISKPTSVMATAEASLSPLTNIPVGQVTLPNPTGKMPVEVKWVVVTKVPIGGYLVGEEISLDGLNGFTTHTMSTATPTEVSLVGTSANPGSFYVSNKTNGSYLTLDSSKFKVKAYIFTSD